MTLLISVPIESPIGTFQKFPYHKPIRVQNESCSKIFSQSQNKFIVLITSDIHWTVTSSYDYSLKTGVLG